MASATVRYVFEFDADEIKILLKLVGRESRDSIAKQGLNVTAHDRLYNVLSEIVYAPISEDSL